jgi:lactoylglutathione lyase
MRARLHPRSRRFSPVPATVHELRVAVTAPDYDEALVFYRDVLGLRELAA